MAKVLTLEECKTEYQKTLDRLALVAVFQYTFIATVLYISLAVDPSKPYAFLGFELSRIAWAMLHYVGLTTINIHMVRLMRHLTRLYLMHPKLRRKLRFFTWHHHWLFNPFVARVLPPEGIARDGKRREKRVPNVGVFSYSNIPMLTNYGWVYLFILLLPIMPFIADLTVNNPAYEEFTNQEGFWQYYVVSSIFVTTAFFSTLSLHNTIFHHRNVLWGLSSSVIGLQDRRKGNR